MADARDMGRDWRALDPAKAHALSDARLQLHHAAQLVSAIGISYLPRESDDSHTNLEWLEDIDALASHAVGRGSNIRLAVRPSPFELLVLDRSVIAASLPLRNSTVDAAAEWARRQLTEHGVDGRAYTLAKHFTIPHHRVDDGGAFDSRADEFEQLGAWYSDASRVLSSLVESTANASPVRCWPHHFDIATLIEVAPAGANAPRKTMSVGMDPGDVYYDEPYFYASMSPSPPVAPMSALAGGGSWHAHEWIGAVLPGSHLQPDGQQPQVAAFLDSAVRACRTALMA